MLTVRLLGQFTLMLDDGLLTLPYQPTQALLAHLLLQKQNSFRRDELAGRFWPHVPERNARNNLRQNLWRLRQVLGSGFVKADRSQIWLEPGAKIRVDVHSFWQGAAEANSSDDLLAASHFYGGELLPGFYEDWVLATRHQLKSSFDQLMERLLNSLSFEGRWHEVVRQAESWLAHGEVQEAAFRALMTAYDALGEQGTIVATFQRCTAALKQELDVDPSLETVRLFDWIANSANDPYHQNWPPTNSEERSASAFLPKFLDENAQQALPTQEVCVCRESELDRLMSSLEQSLAGQASIALVAGEAGHGKSCLLREFARQAQRLLPELLVVWGISDVYTGPRDPFMPFRDILVMLTGGVEDAWQASLIDRDAAKRLWSFLPESTAALANHGVELIDTFVPGIPLRQRWRVFGLRDQPWLHRLERRVERNALHGPRRDVEQIQLLQQFADVVQMMARQRPILLLLDDLHWADRASLGLLGHLSQRLESAPVMIVGAYRPEEIAHGRRGEPHPLTQVAAEIKRRFGDVVINLDKSEIDDARMFVDALLDSQKNRLSEPFRQLLARHTEGHPLFAVELLRELETRGKLRKDLGGYWVATSSLKLDFVPPRVEGVIEQRIGRLDPDLRQLLRVASIIGETFSAEVAAAALNVEAGPLLARISRELVVRYRLVATAGNGRIAGHRQTFFRFRHQLYQNYLLQGMAKPERSVLHERVADALARLYDTDQVESGNQIVQLAHHYRQAGRAHEAAAYLRRAGDLALDIAAYDEATIHFEEALQLLAYFEPSGKRDRLELDLLLPLARCYYLVRGDTDPGVLHLLSRAAEIAARLPDDKAKNVINLGLWNYLSCTADSAQALALAERLQKASALCRAPMQQAAAFALARSREAIGEFEGALEICDQALALSSAEPNTAATLTELDGLAACHSEKARVLWALGFPDEALRQSELALLRARSLDQPASLRTVLIQARVVRIYRREWEGCGQLIEEELALSRQYGIVSGIDGAGFHGALLIAKRGDPAGSIPLMEQTLAKNRAIKLLDGLSWDLHFLAQTYSQIGDFERADSTLAEALEFVEQSGERFYLAEILRTKGELCQLRGRPAAKSEGYLQQALAVARQQAAKSLELRVASSLARHWAQQGRRLEGYEILRPVFDWFTEGFGTIDLQEAHSLLASLST